MLKTHIRTIITLSKARSEESVAQEICLYNYINNLIESERLIILAIMLLGRPGTAEDFPSAMHIALVNIGIDRAADYMVSKLPLHTYLEKGMKKLNAELFDDFFDQL